MQKIKLKLKNIDNNSSKEKHNGLTGRRFRDVAIVLIPCLILMIIVLMIFYITNQANSYRINGNAVQYYANQEFKLPDDAILKREKDNSFHLKLENDEYELDRIPIYYKDEPRLVLSSDMIYFAPREDLMARVNGLSVVKRDNGNLFLEANKKEKDLKPGFLFDGENTYIFLEPVVLKFDGYKYNLGSLSYIEANNNSEIIVYNHDNGEMIMNLPQGIVTAETTNGEYKISLLNDSIEKKDGTKMLLFNRPDQLDSYFK